MIVVNEIHDFEEILPQVQHFAVSGSQSGQIIGNDGLSAFFLFMSSGARSVWWDPFFEKGCCKSAGKSMSPLNQSLSRRDAGFLKTFRSFVSV